MISSLTYQQEEYNACCSMSWRKKYGTSSLKACGLQQGFLNLHGYGQLSVTWPVCSNQFHPNGLKLFFPVCYTTSTEGLSVQVHFNKNKMKVMAMGTEDTPDILLDEETLEHVDQLSCLGNLLTADNDCSKEIHRCNAQKLKLAPSQILTQCGTPTPLTEQLSSMDSQEIFRHHEVKHF